MLNALGHIAMWLFVAMTFTVIVGAPILIAVGCIRMMTLLVKTAKHANHRQAAESKSQRPRPAVQRGASGHARSQRRPPLCMEALGVDNSATPDEVVAAYRQLALERHPDRGGNPDEFKRLHRHFEQAMAYAEGRSVLGPNNPR